MDNLGIEQAVKELCECYWLIRTYRRAVKDIEEWGTTKFQGKTKSYKVYRYPLEVE